MTIELWCLFAAAMLHFVSNAPLAKAQAESVNGYDNNNPREQQVQLAGWGKRAFAAHLNQIESFPLFAAGILVTTVSGMENNATEYLAIAYIVARLAYLFCYLKDLATLRSSVWGIGMLCTLALMCSPAWA